MHDVGLRRRLGVQPERGGSLVLDEQQRVLGVPRLDGGVAQTAGRTRVDAEARSANRSAQYARPLLVDVTVGPPWSGIAAENCDDGRKSGERATATKPAAASSGRCSATRGESARS